MNSPYPKHRFPSLRKTRKKSFQLFFVLVGLSFSSALFSQSTTESAATFLPVIIINWKAELIKNKVVLNWTTTMEKYARHYIIEKSTNGINYNEIGLIKVAGNSDNRKDYTYTDKTSSNAEVVYYRLKSADMDGKNRVSEVRIIRLGNLPQNVSITTYPNPAVNELKISLPGQWLGKKVAFEIYNLNGRPVKRLTRDSAGETESMMVDDLANGLYIVKATSGSESVSQRLVKTK